MDPITEGILKFLEVGCAVFIICVAFAVFQ